MVNMDIVFFFFFAIFFFAKTKKLASAQEVASFVPKN